MRGKRVGSISIPPVARGWWDFYIYTYIRMYECPRPMDHKIWSDSVHCLGWLVPEAMRHRGRHWLYLMSVCTKNKTYTMHISLFMFSIQPVIISPYSYKQVFGIHRFSMMFAFFGSRVSTLWRHFGTRFRRSMDGRNWGFWKTTPNVGTPTNGNPNRAMLQNP